MKIVIYTKNNCPFCQRVKMFLTSKNFDFEEYVIGKDIEREILLQMFPTAQTVPIIIIDGERIDGYVELMNYFNKQE